MKSKIRSKCNESNTKTIVVSDDLNDLSPLQGNIKFKFANNTLSTYDLSTISCINPYFFSSVTNKKIIEIALPSYITSNLLMEFLFLVKNGLSDLEECPEENSKRILSLLRVSEYFNNDTITLQIISDVIMPKLNSENSFEYLKFSYDKLKKIKDNKVKNNSLYFDLFYRCLEIIGNNIQVFIKNINSIKQLDSKVLDELIQKCFATLVLGNYILVEDDQIDSINTYNEMREMKEIDNEDYFDSEKSFTKREKCKNNNTFTNFISKNNMDTLIKLLYDINQCDNIYDALTKEYLNLFTSEMISSLSSMTNPTFQIRIPYDIKNYYEEYPVAFKVNDKNIIFVLFYKKSDDSFNVYIKMGEGAESNEEKTEEEEKKLNLDDKYCFQIFTFLSIVKLNDDSSIKGNSQTNLKSICSNKSMQPIFKLSNFRSMYKTKMISMISSNEGMTFPSSNKINVDNEGNLSMNNNSFNENTSNDFFNITINLKLCFIHSALLSHLVRNFSSLSHETNINKLSKSLLLMILKNKYLNKKNENEVVKALLNWLNDEINIKEDITELIGQIKWEDVSDEIMFEFIIKYAHMLTAEESENIFIKAIQSKYDNTHNENIKNIMIGMIKGAQRVDYSNVYSKMKKNEKYNQLYMCSPMMSNEINSTANMNNSRDITMDYNCKDNMFNAMYINETQYEKGNNRQNKIESTKKKLTRPVVNFKKDIDGKPKLSLKNNTRNKRNIITNKINNATKITRLSCMVSPQHSNKKKDAFKREDKNCLSCGTSQNRSKIFNKPKQKKANTIIMKYITESKQMNTYKKINCNRNKTQHYFSPQLSYSNNIKKKPKK